MRIGIPKESFPGERRVALVPGTLPSLSREGFELVLETGAGAAAGFADAAYEQEGARVASSRADVFCEADVIVQVRTYGSNLKAGRTDLRLLRPGQVLLGFADPLMQAGAMEEVAATRATLFAMELVPRVSRAQSMDALSSMATIAGYKAVLLAAMHLSKMFPMMMTAAGTITPARVLVVGAGVAGLQAIATSRRLGAVVRAYDVRPAVKEQVTSLGARFLEVGADPAGSEDQGGYAKDMGEDFYRRQRDLLASVVTDCDVIITTAAVPGKKAPVLITREMVQRMRPGSIIVDVVAVHGGNCELSRSDETVIENGVTILGPADLAATVPFHASQMYSKNVSSFLLNLAKDGSLDPNSDDEIVRETLVTRGGKVVHPKVREAIASALTGVESR